MARIKVEKKVKEEPLEKQLWKTADKLRKNIIENVAKVKL
jgi:type I restriction enzyme M protein